MIRCALDADECIDLLSVLRVVNQINQEQAWATCFQLAQLIQRLSPANCVPIESLAQIYLHKDGFVHEKSLLSQSESTMIAQDSDDDGISGDDDTLGGADMIALANVDTSAATNNLSHNANLQNTTNSSQQTNTTITTTTTTTTNNNNNSTSNNHQRERQLVASVGIALFWALDFGIPDDEERKLSSAMECLIVKSQSELRLNELIEVTINRLSHELRPKAESHYRNICKSLVSDTIELSIFLEKIYTATMVLGDLSLADPLNHKHHHKHLSHHHLHHHEDEHDHHHHHHHSLSELGDFGALRINDWARLWMQVIRELRQRGRFKQALAVN